MKIVVSGIGYVGLSNAVLLSQKNEVVAVDIDKNKVDLVNKGNSPFRDTDIEKFLSSNNLNLGATVDISAYKEADFIIIAVPTNYDEDKNYFDTSIVESVINTIDKINTSKATIVIKSTIPIGFTDRMSETHLERNILFSPEFLREGQALQDNLYPSRIIVSGNNKEKASIFAKLLQESARKTEISIQIIGSQEAESVKLFSNTYLAMRVAFFNELDTFAKCKKLDTKSIIDGMTLDPRIGDIYNNPSFGYGGYCLPKDTKQLLANYNNIPQSIISSIVSSNKLRKDFIIHDILWKINLKDDTVGIYRLTMKSNSDNFRQSAIIDILKGLKTLTKNIIIYEPTIQGSFCGVSVENNLEKFKKCSVIVANRITSDIIDVANKVYSPDVYGNN